jgi:hypothetical protein
LRRMGQTRYLISNPRLRKVKDIPSRARNLYIPVSRFYNSPDCFVKPAPIAGKVLPDSKSVASCEIKEKDFLVLMVSKVRMEVNVESYILTFMNI